MQGRVAIVAIIGGGTSGTLLAIQLLSTVGTPLSIKRFEPRERLGRGVAYSTGAPVVSEQNERSPVASIGRAVYTLLVRSS